MINRFNIRARLMTGGAIGAVAMMAFAGAASAQTTPAPADPDATQVDEVVVTGIRASIANSIAAKARNTSIVEVISAEDIGKLPDVSIAESLGRLPGLSTQRLDGRSQALSIRGLGPDFTTALLNGREQVTTGDNRGVEFDQYPSELLSGVTVYKTPDAGLIGQGLAGTVDMQTIRPLSYGHRTIAVNARYELNDIGALNSGTTDHGNRYSISYIDQFLDGTLGVAIGYAHMESPYQSERFNSWGYANLNATTLVEGGIKPYVMSSELKRDGYMGTLEWKPNDRFSSTIDAFYSKFENSQVLRGIEFPLQWGGSAGDCTINVQSAICRPGPALRAGYTVQDGLVTKGIYDNVKGVVRNDFNGRNSEITSIGWNTKFQATDDWGFALDLNYSKVDRTDQILESYSGTGRNIAGQLDSLGFTLDGDGVTHLTSNINYADPNLIRLTSPQGWGGDIIPGGQDGYLNTPTITDEIKAVRLTARRELHQTLFSSIDFGFNYTERSKDFVNDQYFLGVPGGASAVVPAAFLLAPTELGYLGIPAVLSYDSIGLVNSGFYNKVRNPNADVLSGNWAVTEKVSTTYIKANIDHTLFGLPLTGNVGIQAVYTDQSSSGFSASGTGASTLSTPVTGGAEYLEILPSSNFILDTGNDTFVRFAVARTLARPRMDDMRASRNYSFDVSKNNASARPDVNSPWGGGGGNPELKPYIADVVDLSVEKYFANRRGYVSLAAFYKNLETFVYTKNQIFDFTGYPTGGVVPVINQGVVSAPANGEGGYIQGFEFALSVPFEVVHPMLEGFGAQFSYSETSSEIQPDPTQAPTAVPGLSEKVANLTVYYERDGFQARISDRYRSDYLGEVAGFGNGRTLRSVAAENVVDAQIGYTFQSGPLENLGILAQVNNLTDEPFKTFQNGDERQTIDFQRYGRTFLFGVSYKY
ncbi:MAG: TonB-dependent receptor [Caulobacteraceae bacterium]|nr:TonB-dependent receptor [Caulobacteraceae bacterium]